MYKYKYIVVKQSRCRRSIKLTANTHAAENSLPHTRPTDYNIVEYGIVLQCNDWSDIV